MFFTPIITLLAWPTLYRFVWDVCWGLRSALITVISGVLINAVIKLVLKKRIYAKYKNSNSQFKAFTKNRHLWNFFDMLQALLTILSPILLMRVLMCSLMRLLMFMLPSV